MRARAADAWIRERGLRIYRRPLSEEEVAGYLAQFISLAADSTLAAARAVLTSMLLSPYFLFRVELGIRTISALAAPQPDPLPRGTPLSAYEVAARLSHFLQRRAPDPALLERAASDDLRTSTGLRAEVERLLATPESLRARTLQHLEWLGLDELHVGGGDEVLAKNLQAQTSLFITDVLERRGGSFTELLTSAEQPLNAALAQHYGLRLAVGEPFELVTLDPRLHAGVLGQGAWLTQNPTPTYRGLSLFHQLLCADVPPHPAQLVPDEPTGTTPRERILSITGETVCQGCHQPVDRVGFALEAFDGQGRLTGFDTSGELSMPSSGDIVPLADPVELGGVIAASYDGKRCIAQRHVEQVLEHPYDDEPSQVLFDCLVLRWGRDLDLNQLTRDVAISDAMLLTSRPAISVSTASSALDPIDHALEETVALASAFDGAERRALLLYQESLRQIQAERKGP